MRANSAGRFDPPDAFATQVCAAHLAIAKGKEPRHPHGLRIDLIDVGRRETPGLRSRWSWSHFARMAAMALAQAASEPAATSSLAQMSGAPSAGSRFAAPAATFGRIASRR